MDLDAQKERIVSIHFGRGGELKLSRSTVGDFIGNEMHLTGKHGDPQWSKGIRKLIRLGMEAHRLQEIGESLGGGNEGRIEDLERQVAEYRQKIEELESQTDKRDQDLDLIEASDRVHMSEARILEVLDRNEGTESMNFVDLFEIVSETGLSHETVSRYVRLLSKSEYGGHVIWDERRDSAKAINPEAFRMYCRSIDLDPDEVRAVNDPR